MNDTNVDSMFDSRREGISGSKFTIAFVIFLAAGVIFGFLAAIRFQRTMTAFDDVRLKWPAAAASIDDQIQSIDTGLEQRKSSTSAEPVSTEFIPVESIAGWDKAVTDFRQSSQYGLQVLQLDPLLEEWKKVRVQASGDSELLFPKRTQAVAEFIDADTLLGKLQTDLLGKVCQAIFGLNLSNRVFQKL